MDVLNTAAAMGHVEICKMLVEKGMTSLPATFDVAAENGQVFVLKWLHERPLHLGNAVVNAKSVAGAVRKGLIPAVQYIYDKLDILSVPQDLALVSHSSIGHNMPHVFPDDLVLTAMANGQDRMVDALVDLGLERQDPAKSRYAKEFAEGTYPLFKGPYECVKVIEDPVTRTNMQMWARRVPLNLEEKRRTRMR
jgi:hypothetical protein